MRRDPEICVVVATHQRARLLPSLFAGLDDQLHGPGAVDQGTFEVVVVDDASGDDTGDVLARLAARASFPVRVEQLGQNSGPATARNRGWRLTAAPVVVFTDDDCRAQPGWLTNLRAGIEAGADIVQGRTTPDPDHLDDHGPFGRTLQVPHEEGFYETCNIAYQREWLERLGGFDETYRHPYGEDTDLAWRAREAGAVTSFAHDAVVHHAVFPSDWWAAMRSVARSEGLHQTIHRHPGLREQMGKRLFHRQTHAWALAAVAGAALVAARPRSIESWSVAAALGARYAWLVRQHHRPPTSKLGWIPTVPAALVLDLYETVRYAEASARHRTVLL